MMENEMTLTNQRDFLVLLAVYVNQDNCSREAIVTYIYDEGWIVLSADELSKRTKDNKKYIWKVNLAYARKRLNDNGCIDSGTRNRWLITQKGIEQLIVRFEDVKVMKHPIMSEKLVNDAEKIVEKLLLSSYQKNSNSSSPDNKEKACDILPTETEREAYIKQRIGQGTFRKKLLARSRVCQICGLTNESLLRASHVMPWADSSSEEKLDVDNGLLLCVFHAGLSDTGLLTFSPDGKIMISDVFSEEDRERINLSDSIELSITDSQSKYFQYHREYVFQK